eukprot:603770-Rhodomonas_salina.7
MADSGLADEHSRDRRSRPVGRQKFPQGLGSYVGRKSIAEPRPEPGMQFRNVNWINEARTR